jgi:hypothetical protein
VAVVYFNILHRYFSGGIENRNLSGQPVSSQKFGRGGLPNMKHEC